MKAIIKRCTNIDGQTFLKVIEKGRFISSDYFFFKNKEEEAEAYKDALKLAIKIENNEATEEIIYETGMQPIDYFAAANMNDEQLNSHLENIKK